MNNQWQYGDNRPSTNDTVHKQQTTIFEYYLTIFV